jgi:hypothetical protein
MADNYILSSFQFELENEKEIAWWKKEGEREVPDDMWSDEVDPRISLDWELCSNEHREDSAVWFHHDESIDVENAAEVIARFLKECECTRSIAFTWAETCSKARLEEFGGGACFITAEGPQWLNTHMWVNEKADKHCDKMS